MALRARLVAPPPKPRELWPYHKLKSASVPASLLFAGDRRMEAGTYLSSGFGIRASIESKASGWVRLGTLADFWCPPRIKQIEVGPHHGVPYFNTSQVFGVMPTTRKWLAFERTTGAARRLVEPGTILMMASATPGRCTIATEAHRGAFVSHHFMRVVPKDTTQAGWVYAFLRSVPGRAMTSGAQYASIIRHIEPHHAEALPIPTVPDAIANDFNNRVSQILKLRNEGHRLTLEAAARYEQAFGPLKVKDWGENGFEVKASRVFLSGRRRFEAAVHNPGIATIRRHLETRAKRFETIAELGLRVWLPGRFKRIAAADGVLLVESGALIEVNPSLEKRIAEVDFGDEYQGRVEPGWLLVARSGQVYGINGTAVIANKALSGHVISDDVLRVAPTAQCTIPMGYLWVALSHPVLGRALVKSLAYGSSIPHIDPEDFSSLPVVRLSDAEEREISALAEKGAGSFGEADVLERSLADDAGSFIDRFIAGRRL